MINGLHLVSRAAPTVELEVARRISLASSDGQYHCASAFTAPPVARRCKSTVRRFGLAFQTARAEEISESPCHRGGGPRVVRHCSAAIGDLA